MLHQKIAKAMEDDVTNNANVETVQTKRVISSGLESILYNTISVLDHGFIRVIDYMGNDNAIVQAARVSYGRGTKKVNQDRGLINYLMRHRHTTPFEMCEIKFHVKLPIFVARQWIRHRTASINEYSARYSILGNEFYLPTKENLGEQSTINRQGRSNESLSKEFSGKVLQLLKNDATTCYDHYIEMMNHDEYGNIINVNQHSLSRELARMNLTLNYYTQWYWKVNLHNLLHFLLLRADSHAQYEIRVYAEEMLKIMKAWVPFVYDAFNEYALHGAKISNKGLQVIKRMINREKVTRESSGMSLREWNELMDIL